MKTGQHHSQIRSSYCKAASLGVAQLQWDKPLCLEEQRSTGKIMGKCPVPHLYLL